MYIHTAPHFVFRNTCTQKSSDALLEVEVGGVAGGLCARVADVALRVETLGHVHGGGGAHAQAGAGHTQQLHRVQSQRSCLRLLLLRDVNNPAVKNIHTVAVKKSSSIAKTVEQQMQ